MLDERKAPAGVVPFDHEPGARAAENGEMTIMWAEYSR
ncbi:hypothetical protein M2222_002018 [Bradyrhizobium elkanii]|jgi:hypothetical protein|nr:hypothetical protein [Bradyrhizobium elkanii]MCS3559696.1 hypothetical protein [Bradyrhizobium elkanii]MCW2150458.1 hypothetical protein [Bradyrhizobium elkanii]MCW2359484.1 hypothetical protein [Bradyrhizobium elkanii]MCW2374189.1 hypothetical protein [Bradyrhizobium elkanii]